MLNGMVMDPKVSYTWDIAPNRVISSPSINDDNMVQLIGNLNNLTSNSIFVVIFLSVCLLLILNGIKDIINTFLTKNQSVINNYYNHESSEDEDDDE